MLSNHEIMILNDAIYKIHTTADFDEMRLSVLKSLEFIVPASLLTFYITYPDNPDHMTDAVGIAEGKTLDANRPGRFHNQSPVDPLEISLGQYSEEFEEIDYTRWVFSAPSAKVYRETDFMSDEERMATEYYKRMYMPLGIHYSIILSLIFRGTCYGCICLYRRKKDGDFLDQEMMILELLKDHLSFRLARHRGEIAVADSSDLNSVAGFRSKVLKDYDLTNRETEILNMLLDGASRDHICEELFIAPNTLKKHTMHIYKKLNVGSWRELFGLFKQ